MLFTFIRHSKTLQEKTIPSILWKLSPQGILLAQKLAVHPDIASVDVFYSSFQTKALETTLILAKDQYKSIVPNNSLMELTSITNDFIPDYNLAVEQLYTGAIDTINGGETILEARARFTQGLEHIYQQENLTGKNNVGIVTHGNILSIFCAEYSGESILTMHHKITMPDHAIFNWETKQFIKQFGTIQYD